MTSPVLVERKLHSSVVNKRGKGEPKLSTSLYGGVLQGLTPVLFHSFMSDLQLHTN